MLLSVLHCLSLWSRACNERQHRQTPSTSFSLPFSFLCSPRLGFQSNPTSPSRLVLPSLCFPLLVSTSSLSFLLLLFLSFFPFLYSLSHRCFSQVIQLLSFSVSSTSVAPLASFSLSFPILVSQAVFFSYFSQSHRFLFLF